MKMHMQHQDVLLPFAVHNTGKIKITPKYIKEAISAPINKARRRNVFFFFSVDKSSVYFLQMYGKRRHRYSMQHILLTSNYVSIKIVTIITIITVQL
jgi:hypothetical protein